MQRTARRQGRAAGHCRPGIAVQKEHLVVGAAADTLGQGRTAALARSRSPEHTTTPVSTAIVPTAAVATTPVSTAIVGTSAIAAPAGCQAL
jgi:hypothetical protein